MLDLGLCTRYQKSSLLAGCALLAFLLSVFLLVSGPALASTDEPQNVEELIAAVEGTYGDVESLRPDFVQVVRSAGGRLSPGGPSIRSLASSTS